jgi:hypothetical protein
MSTDYDERIATMEKMDISKLHFPDIDDQEIIDKFSRLIESEVESWDVQIDLDRLIAGLEEVEDSTTIDEKSAFQVFVDAERHDLLRGLSGQWELGKDFCFRCFKERQGRVGDQDQDEDNAENDQHAAKGDNPPGDSIIALGADAEFFIH